MAPKLKKVIRLDSLPLGQTMFTSEGYFVDRPILTTTGIFEYSNPDGSVRRELRLPDEVFAEESLKSYKGKPIIITHDAGLVNKDNVSEEQIGTILTEGYRSGDDVRAEIVIHDTDEMKRCGLKELSLGYGLDLDETPGEWNGQHYDAIQRNIRINHLALVREARAGESARLNIDGRDSNILKGGKIMAKKTKKKATSRRDGILSKEELAEAIKKYQARKAERMACLDEEEPATKPAETDVVTADDDDTVVAAAGQEPETVEEKVQLVKDRRDRRDEAGDPETTEEAQGVIAHQDEDIDTLIDIIDTLLAEKAFDEAEDKTEEAAVAEDEDDEEAVVAEDEDDEVACDEDEETAEVAEDEDDEEEAVVAEDEDDEEAEAAVAEDEDDELQNPTEKMNADSIDKIVRTRIQIGMVGRQLNMDGLENLGIKKAKKAVIKKVRPGIRLDGKSDAYVNALFDCCVDSLKKQTKKDTTYQKKQMFNKSTTRHDGRSDLKSSAEKAREKMISRQNKKEGK